MGSSYNNLDFDDEMKLSDIEVGLKFKSDNLTAEVVEVNGQDVNILWSDDRIPLEYSKKDIIASFICGNWIIINNKDQLLAQIAELQKQVEEIEKKEEEKYFDLITEQPPYIVVRGEGNYKNKGFYLTKSCNWEILTDSENQLVLVPTKKL